MGNPIAEEPNLDSSQEAALFWGGVGGRGRKPDQIPGGEMKRSHGSLSGETALRSSQASDPLLLRGDHGALCPDSGLCLRGWQGAMAKPFPTPIYHSCIFFNEVSVYIFCSLFFFFKF